MKQKACYNLGGLVAFLLLAGTRVVSAEGPQTRFARLGAQPRYVVAGTSFNDPLYFPTLGSGYDGVVLIQAGGFLGTGALIADNVILTVAHLLDEDPDVSDISVFFELPGGAVQYGASSYVYHENWTTFSNPDALGYDIGLIFLDGVAPQTADRYQLYTGRDEVAQESIKIGYGETGLGTTGNTAFDGRKRFGKNRYDTDSTPFLDSLGLIYDDFLVYDFDNGTAQRDAMAELLGASFAELGFGFEEVNSAPGDSGGPTFINGRIAGLTSWGIGRVPGFNLQADLTNGTDSSFGEISFDTRVSTYIDWINARITTQVQAPEPASLSFLTLALSGFLVRRKAAGARNQGAESGEQTPR